MIATMKQRGSTTILPKVSFIIPTLNASMHLPSCLAAITTQNYPTEKREIIIADAFSTDDTRKIAKKFHAKIIDNPEILHEPGKTRASKIATGKIFFYTDADNILSNKNWILSMVQPYLENNNIVGFLPQTIPAPDSNALDRYLGHICTDPFTWFIYGGITSGRDFPQRYHPLLKTKNYSLYTFPIHDPPLFGLSQGAGSLATFNRGKIGYADDLLAAIKIIKEKGVVAYVPSAGVYHYHVSGVKNYVRKYAWRIRNNLSQQVKGMGVVNRRKYFGNYRKLRMLLFVPYGLTVLLPTVDAAILTIKHRDLVMFWHIPASFLLSFLMVSEYIKSKMPGQMLGAYE